WAPSGDSRPMGAARTWAVSGVVVLGLVGLAGCGSDEPDDVELGDGVVPTSEEQDDGGASAEPTEPGTGGTTDSDATDPDAAAAEGGASPAPGECVDLPLADDG